MSVDMALEGWRYKTCPVCGRGPDFLVYHHWLEGMYVHFIQICNSCNSVLGVIFKGDYPVWSEQLKKIRNYFDCSRYSDYPKEEVREYPVDYENDSLTRYIQRWKGCPGVLSTRPWYENPGYSWNTPVLTEPEYYI